MNSRSSTRTPSSADTAAAAPTPPPPRPPTTSAFTYTFPPQYIWFISGPAGCGKTSVAKHLSERLGFSYVEGDDYHPQANIDKMSRGVPLTDDDRWDWLVTLRREAVARLRDAPGCIVTCSALKRRYRDLLREASAEGVDRVLVRFVYLKATQELLLRRVRERKGHYMKDDMVKSQFDILEEPTAEERDVVVVGVEGPLESVLKSAVEEVRRAME